VGRNTPHYPASDIRVPFTVEAGDTVWGGSMVCIDTATGYLIPADDTASTRIFVGVAMEDVEAPSVDTDIEVMLDGVHQFGATSIADTDLGAAMYVKDDQTFDDTSSNLICCGKLIKRDSNTLGWIDIGVAAQLSTAGTSVTFSDTGTYYKIPALSAVNHSAALMELHLDTDQHACDDGDGTYTVDPETNRQHFAKAIQGNGTGISHYVHASGDITAKVMVNYTGETSGIPTVDEATNTTGTRPGMLFCPVAISSGAKGWAYKVYTLTDSGVDQSGGAVGDPMYRGVDGALTATKPSGANQTQIVGWFLDAGNPGKCQIDLTSGWIAQHSHTDESEGGEHPIVIPLVEADPSTGWVKDGTANAVATADFESDVAITVTQAFAIMETAPDQATGADVLLNGNALVSFAQNAHQAEAKSLSIDIAKDTDLDLTVDEAAGGAGANLMVFLYCVKQAP
jgi:hypothetical protein